MNKNRYIIGEFQEFLRTMPPTSKDRIQNRKRLSMLSITQMIPVFILKAIFLCFIYVVFRFLLDFSLHGEEG